MNDKDRMKLTAREHAKRNLLSRFNIRCL